MHNNKTNIDKNIQTQEELAIQQKKNDELLREACSIIFSSKAGLILADFLLETSGFIPDIYSPCDVNKETMQYKEGRRHNWAILRNYIPSKSLAKIEIYNKRKGA